VLLQLGAVLVSHRLLGKACVCHGSGNSSPQISQMSSRQLHYFSAMQTVAIKRVCWRSKRKRGGIC